LFGNLELNRSAGFPLDHGGAILNAASDAHVAYPQPHEIATPQLAIDCEIEEREVASTPLKLEPNADGPDLFRFERAFLPREASLVPRSFCKANERWDRGAHDCLLDPTAPAPAQVIRRPTAHNLPMSALA